MSYNALNISVLEGLEAVRVRPGMYIGSTSRKGLNHLVYEIVDNSVDEHLAGFCSRIEVIIEEDGTATVKDNGRGIPIDLHKKGISAERVIFTTLHAGGKFNNDAYKTSGGLHGVGSSVVNALSEEMEVIIKKDGVISKDTYSRGIPRTALDKNGLLPVIGKTKEHGTSIHFKPDATIFETTKFKASLIEERLHETAYLNPSLEILFHNKRDGKEPVIFKEPEGIKGFVRELGKNETPEGEIVVFKAEQNGIEAEIAFQYNSSSQSENIIGFCNNIKNNDGGTHITGFKTAFTKLINGYAKTIGILKDKDSNFTGNDVRNGITCVIAVKHPDPTFEGQTKTKLNNDNASTVVQNIVSNEGTMYFDRHLEELKKIISRAEKNAKIRKAEEKVRTNLGDRKFAFEGNGKLAVQTSKKAEECEIFIVEGDSAGGSAKTARDRKTQAILPIRGKILNVEKQSMDKVLANAEIKAMINAFGCGFLEGYGNDFNIEKLKYDKIVIMTDADVDGAHISTLLLTFFYRFMPDLIKEGHVYRAMPPLYKVEEGTGKNKKDVYLYDDAALDKYRKTHKGQLKLQRYKGLGEMDAEQLWETTLNPSTRHLKKIEIEDGIIADRTVSVLMGTEVGPRRKFIEENASIASIDT